MTAFGNIYEGDAVTFETLFSELEQKHKSIIIRLHTYGGAVFDGNIMYNTIANSRAKVTIHIVGVAASMGAILSLSIEEVYMVENGYLMIHVPSGGSFGTAQELERSTKLLRSIEANFIKKLQQKTGKDAEYVQKWLNGDNWFDAEQALQEGLIKGIIEAEYDFQANFNPQKLPTNEAFNRFNAMFKNKQFNNNVMYLRDKLISKFNLRADTSDTKNYSRSGTSNGIKRVNN
ncbi:head maturation protease, ClpP-related [Capnocytophaga catalasegens]|uniref:head maturation protease, ClpP-related n=1 Tax=Capnocytophaga catalasegens TaxID=1004260 RepID=UPI00223286AF|nr:head maturation protease, ClpP-related [Capnocytophaga catalasegens]